MKAKGKLASWAMAMVCCCAGAEAKDGWGDGFFAKKVLGSFAPEVGVEPLPEPEETEFLNEAMKLLRPDAAAGDREKGVEMLEDGLGKGVSDEGEALFRFTLGNVYFLDRNDMVSAAKEYLAAIEKYGDFLRAHKNVGIIFSRAGKHDKAVEHLAKAINLGEYNDTVFGLIGNSYLKLGRAAEAETAFRNAVMLAPGSPEWKIGLVQSLVGGGQPDAAILQLDTMLASDPDELVLWMLQLEAHIKKKDFMGAASILEVLDAMGEAKAEELTTLGDIYANDGLLDLAAGAYLRAYEKDPASVERPLKAAEVLVARDGMALAEELLKRVRSSAGDTLDPKAKLRVMRVEANILFSQGRAEDAATMLEEVIEGDPLDGVSMVRLGDYYAGKGDTAMAERRYQSASLIDSSGADANVKYAQMLVGLGRYEEAVAKLRRAQELKPRDGVGRFLEELEDYVKRRRR